MKRTRSWLLIVLVGLLLCSGCPTPGSKQEPKASITPNIIATDVEKVETTISQEQSSVQIQAFALDAERAKLAKVYARGIQRILYTMIGVLVGFILLMLCLDSPLSPAKRWIAIVAAFAVIIGSLILPFIWPW